MKIPVVVIVFASILPGAAPALAQEKPDVVFQISLYDGVSSDTATICRVRAANFSGHSLSGRSIGFEARALEGGTVVETERGRFSGTLGNGETAETFIGFNGMFRNFEVVSAPAPGGSRSGRSGGGRKSSSKTKSSKAPIRKRKKNAN